MSNGDSETKMRKSGLSVIRISVNKILGNIEFGGFFEVRFKFKERENSIKQNFIYIEKFIKF